MPFTTAAGGSHDVIDRTCSCGTLYRPAPTNSASRRRSRVGAHSNSDAAAAEASGCVP